MTTSIFKTIKSLREQPDITNITILSEFQQEVQISNADLYNRICIYLNFYKSASIKPGDTIIIILKESIDLFASFLAGIVYGALPAFYAYPSPKQSNQQFILSVYDLLKHNDVKLIVGYNDVINLLQNELKENRIIRLVDVNDVPAESCELEQFENCEQAFLQFSSGTTGAKKGVKIAINALFNQLSAYRPHLDLNKQSRIISWLPHYHDMGLIACTLLPFIDQVPIVVMSPFEWVRNPKMLLDAISRYHGTHVWLPNFAMAHLVRSVNQQELNSIDFSTIRQITICSEPLLPETYQKFIEHFASVRGFDASTITNCYAMAENTFAVTATQKSKLNFINVDYQRLVTEQCVIPVESGYQISSAGKPLKNVSVKIIDTQEQTVDELYVGEVCIKSDCMLSDYHNNPEATKDAFLNGWLRTGDLGFLYQGDLYITSRKKEVIIVAGENIYPQDIEQIINSVRFCLPGRNAVFGTRDKRIGTEKIVALIEANLEDHIKIDLLQIKTLVNQKLNVSLAELILLPPRSLKKSTAGKVSRYLNQLAYEKGEYANNSAEFKVDSDSGAIIDRVRECVSAVILDKSYKLKDDDNLFESALIDSFGLVELHSQLESVFKIEISRILLQNANFGSVSAISNTISELLNGHQATELVITKEQIEARLDSLRRLTSKMPVSSSSTIPEIIVNNCPFSGSSFYKFVLRVFGIKIGKNVFFKGRVSFKLRGKRNSIIFEDNVRIGKGVDLRIRENGRIIVESNGMIEDNVRIVAAREGLVHIGQGSEIGPGTFITSGGQTRIGKYCMIASYCNLNSSSHGTSIDSFIKELPHTHGTIDIADDVWIGSGASILMNSSVGTGAIVSSNSLVSGKVPDFAVVAGVPASIIKYRG